MNEDDHSYTIKVKLFEYVLSRHKEHFRQAKINYRSIVRMSEFIVMTPDRTSRRRFFLSNYRLERESC